MKFRISGGAFAALFACALAAPDAAAQQTLTQETVTTSPATTRTIRVFLEDMNGTPIVAHVQYSTTAGEVELAEPIAGGGAILHDAADLQLLRIKDPFAGLVLANLDLSGRNSMDIRICLDGLGNHKVMGSREARARTATAVNGLPNGAPMPVPALVGTANIIPVLPNDNCAGAFDIGSSSSFAYSYAPIIASTDGLPHSACEFFGEDQIESDTWYRWTAPCTGVTVVTNCFAALGDSKIAVYEGDAPCPPTSAELIDCNDDAGCGVLGTDSRLEFFTTAGTQYLFRVGRFPGSLPVGAGEFAIICAPQATNDYCADAEPVGALPAVAYGSTIGATTDGEVPESCSGALLEVEVLAPGVWYSVEGTGGQLVACLDDPDHDIFQGIHDTFFGNITVFCGDCGPDLTCVDAANLPFCHIGNKVSWCSQPGVTYKLLVHGAGGDIGNFALSVNDYGTCTSEPVDCGAVDLFGACCTYNGCVQAHKSDCINWGGTFLGSETDCCGRGLYGLDSGYSTGASIAYNGTPIFSLGADDQVAEVPIGFCFDFYQGTYDTALVSTNGGLSFGGDILGFITTPIASTDTPNNWVAPAWADFWLMAPTSTTGVYYKTDGPAGSRVFTVEWNDVRPFGLFDGELFTFRCKLYEGTNEIAFEYPSFSAATLSTYVVGIENAAGTDGINANNIATGDYRRIYPQDEVLCGASTVIFDDFSSYNFSALDGGIYDDDNSSNGVFSVGNLYIGSYSQIVVDVPYAVFDIGGRLVMRGQGRIDGYTAFMQPDTGPTICVLACHRVDMADDSRITAHGRYAGGEIFVCSDRGSVVLEDGSSMDAGALDPNANTYGGRIHVQARHDVKLLGELCFFAVAGKHAGSIDVEACGGSARAIELIGRLQAIGYGLGSQGGYVDVRAHKGGAWIPDYAKIRVEGSPIPFGSPGQATVTVATQVLPLSPPNGIAPTIVTEWYPTDATCRCEGTDTWVPVPDEEE